MLDLNTLKSVSDIFLVSLLDVFQPRRMSTHIIILELVKKAPTSSQKVSNCVCGNLIRF